MIHVDLTPKIASKRFNVISASAGHAEY